MSQPFNSSCRWAVARLLSGYVSVLVALLLLSGNSPCGFAQVTHVTNPFAGATVYLNPDFSSEIDTAIASQTSGSTLAQQMAVVKTYPTFVWLDRIAAISGGTVNSGRMGLAGHIQAALDRREFPRFPRCGCHIDIYARAFFTRIFR